MTMGKYFIDTSKKLICKIFPCAYISVIRTLTYVVPVMLTILLFIVTTETL